MGFFIERRRMAMSIVPAFFGIARFCRIYSRHRHEHTIKFEKERKYPPHAQSLAVRSSSSWKNDKDSPDRVKPPRHRDRKGNHGRIICQEST